MSIYILAIESSCDDTSAAVIKDGEVLSNIVSVQTAHAEFGGVVPELASREHQIHIIPVVDAALKKAGITPDFLNAIAFTKGPGLLGSLIVGVTFAKSMALSLNIPLIDVHHMHAHVLAHFSENPHPRMPFLCLTVSGGHTQIIKVTNHLEMEILGQTLDDAAGEAFDKTGKMLGLPYPAGPNIDKLAKLGEPIYEFPISDIKNLDFSFSGLKTAIMYFLRDHVKSDENFISKEINNICASVQHTIIETLIQKLKKASQVTGINVVAIAGGVSANSGLRERLIAEAELHNWEYHIPSFEFCRDNAGMIGTAGYYKYLNNEFCKQDVAAEARLPF
ncbi:MAG: tRNA (adenosine(37)-N6)-threonylcarbamoyltransferase complex transferase subunit TsaD [Saprospiraceae bacterium]|nr:tRNA (adenosine(37)-N6)-threonylcarbamoyltransferase complex transferase subunit TsaD [Bacteroidia bacterium]NNE16383.1 tRNA (adenosine(37)-N6)-threonylcarbamoyltransferase complex transferase subunit TsaD [Saprospiraceae bacterium]NNL93513.1 tRNA (adenosine(37)-N6)-threonylcarbamoyltransferase complex transferase subunit TsaD [Saprospiraceae bacterium]